MKGRMNEMTKYVSYVGCYTFHGKSKGIAVFDVDAEKGRFIRREEVSVDNCSYLTASRDHRFLYAAVDEGIAAFRINADGSLEHLATTSIRGMRGCFLNIHPSNRFIAIGGYHDGKGTVLRLNEDGTVGEITAEFYDKGIGSVAERNFRPHISCTTFSPDGRFLFMIDSGIDQIKIFSFHEDTGHIRLKDLLPCELNSGPHRMLFSHSGTYLYVVHELKNYVSVHHYTIGSSGLPVIEELQRVATLPKDYDVPSAACALSFSPDGHHLFASNAGENTIAIYDVEESTGLLTLRNILPISGDYPKDIDVIPGTDYIVSTNRESNSLTFFKANYEAGTIIMNGMELPLDNPSCLTIVSLNES